MTAVVVGSCVLVGMLLAFIAWMNADRAHWRHTWSKWEQFEQPILMYRKDDVNQRVEGVEHKQRRHCEVCNYTEESVI